MRLTLRPQVAVLVSLVITSACSPAAAPAPTQAPAATAAPAATTAPAVAAATTAPAAATTGPTAAKPAAATAAPAPAATTAPAAAANASGAGDRAQTLKIGLAGKIDDPSNMNIYSASVSRSDTGLHQVVYEYFFYNNLQTGEFIPWLAESYQYAADFKSLTVKLRDGVTWSDGQPFNADDVVFTYDLLRKTPSMVWATEANANVTSVDKIDNLNVKFNLKEANPRFHLIREAFPAVGIWGGLTILPKHVWEGQDPLGFKNSPPIGTGPYKLRDATATAVTYDRRDDWWGTKVFNVTPAPKTIQFITVGQETNAALALTANDLDATMGNMLSPGSLQEVSRRNPKVSAWYKNVPYAWLDPCPRAMMVQNATPPFDKAEVRWALSYLIDRKAIVNLAYEGSTTPAWGIWPEYDANKPYFSAIDDLRKQYPSDATDPEKAKQLFSQAGVNPADLKLRYVVDASSSEEMKISKVISDQFNAAGIQVEVQPLSGSVLNDTVLRGDYDIKVHSFCPGYIPENLELFHSKNYVPLGQKAPWYERNSFRYKNPELDAIVDKMFVTQPEDTKTLTDLYHQAMAIWLRDLPVVPVSQAPAMVPINSTYWTGWPTSDAAWNMPVTWWATFDLVLNGYKDKNGKWVGGIKAASQ